MTDVTIRQLIEGLQSIEAALPGGRTRNPRLSFGKVVGFLKDHPSLTVPQLVSMLETARPIRQKRIPGSVNEALVKEWFRRLTDAGFDLNRFEQVYADLKAASDAKKMRKVELERLGEMYANRKSGYKNKAVALVDIRKHFETRLRMHQREAVA